MIDVDELVQGSIDMHLHPGPDLVPRRVDALEAARQAQQMMMRAIVLKNHHYSTAPLAIIVSQLVPGIEVIGSICLDFEVGGLNFHALEASAKLGAKVVWMPTMTSANSRAKMNRTLGRTLEGEGLFILDTRSELVPEVGRILSLVKEYDMVLASGHLSPVETFALVEAARAMGIWKLVITHASEGEFVEQSLSLEDQQRLVQMGAFIEYAGGSLLPSSFGHDPAPMAEAIKSIGAKHFIMSTDLGQAWNPPPAEGMRIFISAMIRNGITKQEIELMAKVNPAKLLGLD